MRFVAVPESSPEADTERSLLNDLKYALTNAANRAIAHRSCMKTGDNS